MPFSVHSWLLQSPEEVVWRLKMVFPVCWCSGAAPEAGDGAQRGGPKQGEAAEEPPGAHRVHTHAEDHAELHPQPLQSECVSVQPLIRHAHQPQNASPHLASSISFSCRWCVLFPRVTEVERVLPLINDTMRPLRAAPDSCGLPC